MDITEAIADWLVTSALNQTLEHGLAVQPGLKIKTLGGMWVDPHSAAFQIETNTGETVRVTVTGQEI